MYVLVLGLDVLGNPFGVIRGLSEGVEAFFYEPFQVKNLVYCEIHIKQNVLEVLSVWGGGFCVFNREPFRVRRSLLKVSLLASAACWVQLLVRAVEKDDDGASDGS